MGQIAAFRSATDIPSDTELKDMLRDLQEVLTINVNDAIQVQLINVPDRPSFIKIVSPSPDISKACFAFLKSLKVHASSFPGLTLASCINCDGENLVLRAGSTILREYLDALKAKIAEEPGQNLAAPGVTVPA